MPSSERFKARAEEAFKVLCDRPSGHGAIRWLAARTGYSEDHLSKVLAGKRPVSEQAEAILGELEARAKEVREHERRIAEIREAYAA